MKLPEIRFNKDLGCFIEKKLSDIAIINPRSRLPKIFEYVDLESVDGTEMRSHRTEFKETAPSRAQRVAKDGDIFYQTVRPYQKNNYLFVSIKDNFVFSTGYAQIRTSINSKYLFTVLQSEKFTKSVMLNCAGTSFPAINPTTLSKLSVLICNNSREQEMVASFFSSLDSQIQATLKKIESLKQIKAASLQSMFPQEGETKPRVRFKGFEEEWKINKLEDCLVINIERNSNNDYGKDDVLSVSDEVGVVNQIDHLGRSYAGKIVSNYKILKENQVVYTKSPLKSKPYGIVKVNKYKTGIVSVLYAVYDAKEGVYPDYINWYFDPAFRINHYLMPLVNKGAKNTMNISDETTLKGKIRIPSYEEQKKIANYFTSLDTQITLQSQRLEKLKQIKAACLDKMFV